MRKVFTEPLSIQSRDGKERWEPGFSLGKALSFHTNGTSN